MGALKAPTPPQTTTAWLWHASGGNSKVGKCPLFTAKWRAMDNSQTNSADISLFTQYAVTMVVGINLLLVLIKPSKRRLPVNVDHLDEAAVVACHQKLAIIAKAARGGRGFKPCQVFFRLMRAAVVERDLKHVAGQRQSDEITSGCEYLAASRHGIVVRCCGAEVDTCHCRRVLVNGGEFKLAPIALFSCLSL